MCQCLQCRVFARVEAEEAERVRREMWAAAVAHVAQRYRLDDADALRHVRLHAINGTAVMQ